MLKSIKRNIRVLDNNTDKIVFIYVYKPICL